MTFEEFRATGQPAELSEFTSYYRVGRIYLSLLWIADRGVHKEGRWFTDTNMGKCGSDDLRVVERFLWEAQR